MKSNLLLIFICLITVSEAHAVDARTLPKGRSRFSFLYARTDGITQKFNDQGIAENITKPYNLNLDAATIGTVTPELSKLVKLLNDTGLRYDASLSGTQAGPVTATDPTKPLLGDALSKGDLNVDVEATQSQSVFQYMHGITDRLSVGFMIPIVSNRVRAGADISKTNNTIQDYKNFFQGANSAGYKDVIEGLQYLNDANLETLQSLALESNGYQRFGSSEQSGVGDINFGGRYNYLKTPKETWINSFQLGFSAPTGKTHAPGAITEVDNGSGVWDIASAHIMNFTPGGTRSPWMLSNGLYYTHRLPGSKIMRVRNSPSDVIPNASTEEPISLHYASKIWTNFAARYSINNVMSFETTYEFYYHGEDRYQGSRNKDYGYLSDQTELYLETLSFTWAISLIDGYTLKQFPVPLDFSLSYFQPMAGKNAVIVPFVTAELAMYF